MHSILIVDDLESIHEMLDAVIQPIGYHTAFASDGGIALEKFRHGNFDIVLTDINMKPMDGIELLRQLKELDPHVIVIMMSGYANIANATQALKLGAFDFLTKPFKVDELMAAIARASAARAKALERPEEDTAVVSSILHGESPAAHAFREAINRHANAHTPLLLVGEVGTQKKLIANIIHETSLGKEAPFVALDALDDDPSDLLDQLTTPEGGLGPAAASAKGGTLYLANIDRVPRDLQGEISNLLRHAKGELRFISSTARNLELLVDKGEFDDALFFRIGSSSLHAPALRDRSEDIPSIARSLLAAQGRSNLQISDAAMNLLKAYHWSGNYSEFKEALAFAAEHAQDREIKEQDLPEKLRDFSSWPSLQSFLEEQSANYRRKVLAACLGDALRAAAILRCDPEELEALA